MNIFDIFRLEYNEFTATDMKRYMRNQFEFIGIRTPERRKIFRDYFKSHVIKSIDWYFIKQCWEQDEREFQYLALDYLTKYSDFLREEDIEKLKLLIINKSWWDTVDGINKIVGQLVLKYPNLKHRMRQFSLEDNFWLRRIAIIHQLGFKEKTEEELMTEIIINNLGETEFFINKAIGWCLRDYSKVNPQWVKIFIEVHGREMNSLSVREASKYI